MVVLFILIVFIVCVGGCRLLFVSAFDLFSGVEEKETYIDKSVHHHTHHHKHEHKSITIIDEQTKKAVFELKKNKEAGK